jgi:hypothetical protein
MSISIPLNEMSFEEKMQTMELLWDDLCHSSESIESPSWHKDILNEREQALIEGADKFIDWETAKKNIKKEIE